MAMLPLNLFTQSLDVRFTVRIEEFLAALLPRLIEFGRCDVPVRPTFLSHGTQVILPPLPGADPPAANTRSSPCPLWANKETSHPRDDCVNARLPLRSRSGPIAERCQIRRKD
jgi:hypothetical protein